MSEKLQLTLQYMAGHDNMKVSMRACTRTKMLSMIVGARVGERQPQEWR